MRKFYCSGSLAGGVEVPRAFNGKEYRMFGEALPYMSDGGVVHPSAARSWFEGNNLW